MTFHVERSCACGCGRTFLKYKGNHRFALRACADRERHRRRPRVVVTRAMRRQWAREAARSRVMGYTLRLLAQLAHLDRDAAIVKAWTLGKRDAYRQRARERRQVAA